MKRDTQRRADTQLINDWFVTLNQPDTQMARMTGRTWRGRETETYKTNRQTHRNRQRKREEGGGGGERRG